MELYVEASDSFVVPPVHMYSQIFLKNVTTLLHENFAA